MKEVVSATHPQDLATTVSSVPSSFWRRLLVRLRSWLEVPYGYQDENGFHYGDEPVPALPGNQAAAVPHVFVDRACDAMLSSPPVSLTDNENAAEHSEDHRRIV